MRTQGWLASSAGPTRVVPLADTSLSLPRSAAKALAVLAGAAAVAAVALAGGLIGLSLAGPADYRTSLGEASLRVGAGGDGQVRLSMPRADRSVHVSAFDAPASLSVAPRKLNRQALIRAASGDKGALAAASRDAEVAAGRALRRAWLWAVASALALGLLAAALAGWVGRARKTLVLALALGPGVLAALAGGAWLARIDATFDSAAFERPSLYRQLAGTAQLPSTNGVDAKAVAAAKEAIDRGDIGVAVVADTEKLSPDDPRVQEAIAAFSD